MKKDSLLIIILSVAVVGLGICAISVKTADRPDGEIVSETSNTTVFFDDGTVKATYSPLRPALAVSMGGGRAADEAAALARISDGKEKPMEFLFHGDGLPSVESVTDGAIVMPVTDGNNGIHDVYVADRSTSGRLVTHYTFPGKRYIVSTRGGNLLVLSDEKDVIIAERGTESLTEIRRFSESAASQTAAGAMSPDDTRFAFIMASGTREQPTYDVFTCDMSDGTIKKIGETPYADGLMWKDAHMIGIGVRFQGYTEIKATLIAE